MQIMKEHAQGLKGVIHCYSYSMEMAKEYVKMGFYIGVGGVVTFKNGRRLKETVEAIPLESILLETDCPYLAPEPFRGKRNNSMYIKYVAEEIADVYKRQLFVAIVIILSVRCCVSGYYSKVNSPTAYIATNYCLTLQILQASASLP